MSDIRNSLKIGFVLDDSLDSTDGVQQYILTLGNWLSTHGHTVHYLVGETIRTDIAHIHSMSRNIGTRFNGNQVSSPLPAGRRKINAIVTSEQFDVLHVQMPYSPLLAHRIIRAADPHTAILGTFHVAPHSWMMELGCRLLAQTTKRSLKRFDKFFAVSTAAAHFAKQTYNIDCEVLPNVVDLRNFAQAKPSAHTGNKALSVCFLGRLVERKGCADLLEAINMLRMRRNIPAFRVIICGRGPLEAELKQYVLQHNLSHQVTFVGYVSEADKPGYLSDATIAVFPSTGGESFGIVLIEAMATGRSVVLGAANPGYSTVLGGHPNSLFPVHNPIALADRLAEYLADLKLRQQTIAWQDEHVRQFDVETVGPQLVEAYRAVLLSKYRT